MDLLTHQLQELATRQQQAEAALLEERAAIRALENQNNQARAPPTASALGMVDTRLLGKPEKWNGTDAAWKDWRFVVRAYLQAAMPTIGDLLDRAEGDTTQVECEHLSVEEKASSQQLYYVLVLLTSDRALDKVQAAGEG